MSICETDLRERRAGDFWAGVKDSLPVTLGVLPFGITCGILAVASGMLPAEAIAMSLLVFAGAAQFVSISMIGQGISGGDIIGFTTLLVNLRHLLMGASLAPYMRRLPLWKQAGLSFGMVDETYAMTMARIRTDGYSASYQFGSNLTFYCVWGISTVAGALAGGLIHDPLSWGIDFAMPATFLALLIPRLKDRSTRIVFIAAAVSSTLSALWIPDKWYIIIACVVAGLLGGLLKGGGETAS